MEAGGDDDVPSVMDPAQWPTNLGSERDWGFCAEPNPHLNGRALPMSMGKVLGGGSSINVSVWARGHKADWQFFAEQAGDPGWGYESVLDIYRRVENWCGPADPTRRGTGGPVEVAPARDPHPTALAVVEGAASIGVRAFDSPNGEMMEAPRGAAVIDTRVWDGKRQSVFRSYTYPYMDRPNLTVLTNAAVRRVVLVGDRASGVEFTYRGAVHAVTATAEVVLSMGAINTPKTLMLSGIGDADHLRRFGIPVAVHLPGVGRNFQDHLGFTAVWELSDPQIPTTASQATMYWTSRQELDHPDLFACQLACPFSSPEADARFGAPDNVWVLFGALSHPQSRGTVELTGAGFDDPIRLCANSLSHPDDIDTAVRCVESMRELGQSEPVRQLVKREVMPGDLKGQDLQAYLRDSAVTYWHQAGTAKMGSDAMSVVDGRLRVHGIEGLRVADASIMPRLTTGNTMAPCVVIGERAAELMTHRQVP